MKLQNRDDWLAQRLELLKPGWRGRLRVKLPEETESSASRELVGTVLEASELDAEPDEALVADAMLRFCANYRDGRFVDARGLPSVDVRMSDVVDAVPL
jgi:hypothetical protein